MMPTNDLPKKRGEGENREKRGKRGNRKEKSGKFFSFPLMTERITERITEILRETYVADQDSGCALDPFDATLNPSF